MKTKENHIDSFTKEYHEIMGASEETVVLPMEWEESGDNFRKFSLYDDYTPVETSGSTTLICDL